ncbi:MAG: GerW family sporulation protein [Firmicutes bacterium]|nr:GerW family sporulation protein [Bacillota bacterium]
MDRHPIESLMGTTLENIKDMVDVNTVVGDPVQALDGTTVIPVSRVSFGFVAGGGEYNTEEKKGAARAAEQDTVPFAGGTGAGVSVYPMGFLVVSDGQVKMIPTNYSTPVDRVMELLPQVLGEIKDVLSASGGSQAKMPGLEMDSPLS